MTGDRATIVAVPPAGGRIIHLHLPGYRPGKRRRSVDDSALCGVNVSLRFGTPLGEALCWTAREPTPPDPRPRWMWCRHCTGHVVARLGLADHVLTMVATRELEDPDV